MSQFVPGEVASHANNLAPLLSLLLASVTSFVASGKAINSGFNSRTELLKLRIGRNKSEIPDTLEITLREFDVLENNQNRAILAYRAVYLLRLIGVLGVLVLAIGWISLVFGGALTFLVALIVIVLQVYLIVEHGALDQRMKGQGV